MGGTSKRSSLIVLGALAAILLAGIGLRTAALVETRDIKPILDERLYLLRAEGLLDGEGYLGSYQTWVRHGTRQWVWMADLPQYPGAYQPPLYAAFIAAVMSFTGRSVFAVKMAQVLLSTATLFLVFCIGRAWYDRYTGLAAAGVAAVYANLIAFSHLLWSETLFTFLFLWVILLLTGQQKLPSIWRAAATGILLGLAALTRSSVIYFLPLLFGWWFLVHRRQWRPAIRSAAIILLGLVAVVTPWTIRNCLVHDGFVLIDTNGPTNLWRGNAATAYRNRENPQGPCYKPPYDRIPMHPVNTQVMLTLVQQVKRDTGLRHPTDLQVMAGAKKIAMDEIKKDPGRFLERARHKVIDMWNPTSFLLRHLQRGWYGRVTMPAAKRLTTYTVYGYLAVMLAGAVGLVLLWRNKYAWLVLLMIFFYTMISATAFGITRFRVPLMPFIIILAVWPFVSIVRRGIPGRRRT